MAAIGPPWRERFWPALRQLACRSRRLTAPAILWHIKCQFIAVCVMGVGHRGASVADDRFREFRAMSAFLPPSTNEQYRGSRFAAWFLALYGLGWIIPGMIHSFLPDGGAGVIAGLDLSHNRNMIIGMFAWAGATQIAHGTVTLIIALRYRALVPLFLLVGLVERALLSWSAWVRNDPPSGHHPPEHYGSLILLPLIMIFLRLALKQSRPTEAGDLR
ncbi:hypothetical protein U1839_05795 [Sphingomonas sp. RT2P30]|uniref:hypothetical protein n=1 Tax=Parasphingomonas halimpatiens TaxID=3096162 RepID=UPI002FCB5165